MVVDRHHPPYKVAGAAVLTVAAVAVALIYLQFRGDFATPTQLTLQSSRAGLVVEPGSKVTYNGVEIGTVSRIGMADVDGAEKARLTLDVDPGSSSSFRPT
ncbi:ABC-type transporter Mla subunit MlaD [Mycobacterium sp. URHB0021]